MDFSEFLFTSYNANILFSTLHMYCKYRIREPLRRLHILTASRTFLNLHCLENQHKIIKTL